jgi:hypothetical protein
MEIFLAFVALLIVGTVALAFWDIRRKRPPKHQHMGSETGRRYMPGMMETGGSSSGFVDDEMIYGYTEITYKCECGHYWNQRIVGRINE